MACRVAASSQVQLQSQMLFIPSPYSPTYKNSTTWEENMKPGSCTIPRKNKIFLAYMRVEEIEGTYRVVWLHRDTSKLNILTSTHIYNFSTKLLKQSATPTDSVSCSMGNDRRQHRMQKQATSGRIWRLMSSRILYQHLPEDWIRMYLQMSVPSGLFHYKPKRKQICCWYCCYFDSDDSEFESPSSELPFGRRRWSSMTIVT